MFKSLLLLLLIGQVAHAASPAAGAIWQANASATAANVNSGFYDPTVASPGTDYSLATGSQANGTDAASSNGTTNPCVITSAGHNFVAADNGNSINFTAGTNWTVQRATIVSTAGNAATLDVACGSAASLTSGTWRMGGALSLQHSSDATVLKLMQPGNKLYIKNGTYTLTGTLNVSAITGTFANKIVWEGYNATPGDKPLPSSGNQPVIKGGVYLFAAYQRITNLQMEHTAGDLIQNGGNYVELIQNKIILRSTTTNQSAIAPGDKWALIGNEIISYNGYGLNHSNATLAAYNYFHDSSTGIRNNNSGNNYSNAYIGNIFDSMSTGCISFTAATIGYDLMLQNTFFGGTVNKTGYGVNFATGVTGKALINNIFYGFVNGIITADATDANQGTAIVSMYNDFNFNTTNYNNAVAGLGDLTTSPAFKNVAQVTGTAGSLSGSVVTDNAADFSNVVNNQDFFNLLSGTGATAGQYLITTHTTHTVTLGTAPGGSGSNITYQVTTGRNFTPTANILTAGLGNLPAALTNSYVAMGAAQPQYTDPAVANVLSTATYTFGSVLQTGTYVGLTAGNVKTGVSFGVGLTGTYDGSDRWTAPSVGDLRSGIQLKNNSTSLNLTGTLVVPSLANTKTGVAGDGGNGTYDGSDRWSDAGIANVRKGIQYKANSTSNNRTGTRSAAGHGGT